MSTVDALLNLALWKEPQQSGAVLGVATLVFFVFEKLQYTVLALLSQALLVLVLGSFLWTSFCKFTSRPAPPVPKLEVSEATVRKVVSQAVVGANEALALLYKLGTGQDAKQTAAAVFALYAASKVGSWFSFVTLGYLVTLAFFSLPKVYETKQPECDALLAAAQSHLSVLLDKLPELPKAQRVTKKSD